MKQVVAYILFALVSFCVSACHRLTVPQAPWSKDTLLFEDTGTEDWQEKWTLDGQRAMIKNTEQGMELIAGPEPRNDTCHMVLWTKQSFQGDICIEYDYTRTDTAVRYVNILYFHATGRGDADYPTDIALWSDKRVVPHMRTYFDNMHAYHISYAAYAMNGTEADKDYIRLRRYNPNKKGLKGTDIPGDRFQTGLFKPYVSYHIQVFKYKDQIEMHIQNKQNPSDKLVCKWELSDGPTYESGRIGLRHMYTRSARYADFKVWGL